MKTPSLLALTLALTLSSSVVSSLEQIKGARSSHRRKLKSSTGKGGKKGACSVGATVLSTCDDTLATDNELVVLYDDLDCSSFDGINGVTITGNGIVLDCKGNKIIGNSSATSTAMDGISITGNVNTIQNCVVEEWSNDGIEVKGQGTKIIGAVSTKNFYGLFLSSSGSATIWDSCFDENHQNGAFLSTSTSLHATKSTFNKNDNNGVTSNGQVTLVDSEALMNGRRGIYGRAASTVLLHNVRACDNDQDGVGRDDVNVLGTGTTDDVFNSVTCDTSDTPSGDICVCEC